MAKTPSAGEAGKTDDGMAAAKAEIERLRAQVEEGKKELARMTAENAARVLLPEKKAVDDRRPGPAVQIAARPKDGFRRLGVHHPAEPVQHPAGTFTVAQIAVLKAEPNLSVVEV